MSNENQGDIVIPVLSDKGVDTGVSVCVSGEYYTIEEHGHAIMQIYSDEVDGLIKALQEFKAKVKESTNA